jgi:hypothetical protein
MKNCDPPLLRFVVNILRTYEKCYYIKTFAEMFVYICGTCVSAHIHSVQKMVP